MEFKSVSKSMGYSKLFNQSAPYEIQKHIDMGIVLELQQKDS